MENVRLHKDIELVYTEKRLQKVTAKATYKHTIIFSENLVAVELHKAKVALFKPIYSGFCILDLSKCLMYYFWYNYIKRRYGNVKLCLTDIDSLLFSCQTEDLYHDMKTSAEYFGTSDYPEEHFLHSDRNRKALGKMEDETNGKPIAEFVGLRSKMYSFTCDGDEFKRAKGISKVTVKRNLKHEFYKNTFFNETAMISSMTALRSHKHKLFGETIQKQGLSAFDDKRYLLNAVDSYAYGHYKIKHDTSNNHDSASAENEWEQICNIAEEFEHEFNDNFNVLSERAFTINDMKITPLLKK
ncbi:uncharacterized protein LOC128245454 [Mya arenaria]|uniref:uncharacterized protein LOC128245454 n=1 Tax=Mya arenaria TaxID=6604 RepID=UPI0022E61FF5|nr:uncharacterized protein LOC128245454 [Mya arenaria]